MEQKEVESATIEPAQIVEAEISPIEAKHATKAEPATVETEKSVGAEPRPIETEQAIEAAPSRMEYEKAKESDAATIGIEQAMEAIPNMKPGKFKEPQPEIIGTKKAEESELAPKEQDQAVEAPLTTIEDEDREAESVAAEA